MTLTWPRSQGIESRPCWRGTRIRSKIALVQSSWPLADRAGVPARDGRVVDAITRSRDADARPFALGSVNSASALRQALELSGDGISCVLWFEVFPESHDSPTGVRESFGDQAIPLNIPLQLLEPVIRVARW